jgi:cardiolipin synthase
VRNPSTRAAAALAAFAVFAAPARAASAPAVAGLAAELTSYAAAHGRSLPPEKIRDLIVKTEVRGVPDPAAALAALKLMLAGSAGSAPEAGRAAAAPAALAARLDALSRLSAPSSAGRLFDGSLAGASAVAVPAGAPGVRASLLPAPAPAPPAPSAADRREAERAADSGSLDRIAGLSDAALAAATPDQKIAMIKSLVSSARSPNTGRGGADFSRQRRAHEAVVRILASAPGAAAFDRIYYRVDPSNLGGALGGDDDIRALVRRRQDTAKPGDWSGLGSYIDEVAQTHDSGKNFVEFLVDGAGAIRPALTAIRTARSTIHVEVFELQGDDIGRAFAAALEERLAHGVKVRLMVDEQGSHAERDQAVQALLDGLKRAGAEVIVREPPLDLGHLDHRKVMVIDGDTAFTGGMNIGKSYQVDWHDQQTLVVGPAVAALQKAFLARWERAGGRVPDSERPSLFPALKEQAGGADVRVVGHVGRAADENIKAMYLRAFLTAQRTIRIANPYFMDPDVVAVLSRRARAGVKVQLVLPEDNDVAIVQRGSRAYYPDLLKAGVEIYEYQGRMAHEKVCVIDGRWTTAGSSNLDARSLRDNDELNLAVDDASTAAYVNAQLFDQDLKRSKRITSYSPSWRERLDRWLGGWL